MPDKYEIPNSMEFNKVDKQIINFTNGTPAVKLDVETWTSHHWKYFITSLPKETTLKQMKELDKYFGFTNSKNAEVAVAWFTLCIPNKYAEAMPAIETFLNTVGRIKFAKPLYKALVQTEDGKKQAIKIFNKAREKYHPLTVNMVEKLLM